MIMNKFMCGTSSAPIQTRRLFFLFALILFFILIISLTSNHKHDPSTPSRPPRHPPIAGGIPLRIMFLGASITCGVASTGDVGFRLPLRNKLVSVGNPVNLVGSQRVGDFKDNDLEGYPGNRIDEVHAKSVNIVSSVKPNIFIIHAGTNDCIQNFDTGNLGVRMGDFVNYLLEVSPNATVIMSTLLTSTWPGIEPCVLDANIQIRKLASMLEREGKRVVLAEMYYEQGFPNRPVPSDISPDGTHPFDLGYAMMAEIFWSAIIDAQNRWFLQAPEVNGILDDGDRSVFGWVYTALFADEDKTNP
ncbi:SGNH hydrolase-type esterase domain-containing protein [Whalleya microplaca]|nr:SGNH hydrolase-type esterase domain-containing protein [Whalleya microplaca]